MVQKPSVIKATRLHLDAMAGAGLCPPVQDLPAAHATFANGILPLQTWLEDPRAELLPYAPSWFTTGVTKARYEPAAECPVWLSFLQSVWGESPDCVALLQEWFGWHLVTDTYLQNFVILVGPRGAGKGTILRTLQRFVGKANYASCNLHDLDGDYALSGWVGKRAVIFPDENGLDDRRIVTPRATSRILQITSFDDVNIQEKYESQTTAVLSARLTMASNIVPTFPDFAGAVARRMIPLQLTRSFYGAEDVTLDAKLSREQDGIAQWALEGLRRVLTAGKFSISDKIIEVRETVARDASPLTQWLKEMLEPARDVNAYVRRDHVWALYRNWARAQNIFLISQPRLGTFLGRTFPVAGEGPRIRDEQQLRARTWCNLKFTADALEHLKAITGAAEFAIDDNKK
jgi:putative DNA primase/helicase